MKNGQKFLIEFYEFESYYKKFLKFWERLLVISYKKNSYINKPARLSSCSQDTGSMPILGSMTTRVKEPHFTISSRGGCMRPPSHLMHTPIICDNVYSLMVARSYNAVTASFQFESDVVLRFVT